MVFLVEISSSCCCKYLQIKRNEYEEGHRHHNNQHNYKLQAKYLNEKSKTKRKFQIKYLLNIKEMDLLVDIRLINI